MYVFMFGLIFIFSPVPRGLVCFSFKSVSNLRLALFAGLTLAQYLRLKVPMFSLGLVATERDSLFSLCFLPVSGFCPSP